METKKAEKGTWTLISPSGVEFKAEAPLECCRKESESRVTAEQAANNILKFLSFCDICGERPYKYVLGKNTPAQTNVCGECKRSILSEAPEYEEIKVWPED